MSVENNPAEAIRHWIREHSLAAPGSIADILDFQLLDCNPEAGTYTFSCQTQPWMRNFSGTLHGGICATVLDQAMSFVAHSIQPDAASPTIQLETAYHRPLNAQGEVMVKVRVVSQNRSLAALTAQAMAPEQPDKVCFSGSSIHFYKPVK